MRFTLVYVFAGRSHKKICIFFLSNNFFAIILFFPRISSYRWLVGCDFRVCPLLRISNAKCKSKFLNRVVEIWGGTARKSNFEKFFFIFLVIWFWCFNYFVIFEKKILESSCRSNLLRFECSQRSRQIEGFLRTVPPINWYVLIFFSQDFLFKCRFFFWFSPCRCFVSGFLWIDFTEINFFWHARY